MSTHNCHMFFHGRVRKILCGYPLLYEATPSDNKDFTVVSRIVKVWSRVWMKQDMVMKMEIM